MILDRSAHNSRTTTIKGNVGIIINHPFLGMVYIPTVYGDLGDGLCIIVICVHPHYRVAVARLSPEH